MRGLKREPKDNIIAESLPEIVPGRFCEDSSKGTDLPEIFLQKNLGQRAFARTRADGPPVTDPPARPTCTWEELLTIIQQAVYEISQRVHGLTNRGRNCRLTGIYRSLRRWQRCTHTHTRMPSPMRVSDCEQSPQRTYASCHQRAFRNIWWQCKHATCHQCPSLMANQIAAFD